MMKILNSKSQIPSLTSQVSNLTNSKGFSMLEVLLYVAMLSLILFTIVLFLTTMLAGRIKNQSVSEVEQQGAFVMAVITQNIRNASTVRVPSAGLSGSTLTFTNTIGTSQTFDVSGTTLRFNDGTGAVALTNSHVAACSVSFQNLKRSNADGTIKIQFTLTYGTSCSFSGRNENDYSKTFYGTASLR